MASQDERATESALEDLLGASTEQSTDSDADFVDVQAEALSDSDSVSTQLPSQLERPIQREQVDDGAPGSSAAVTRTRRPITRELTHLTYLNTPGLSQEQRNHIRRLREQERRRRQEDRQNRTQERRNQRAAVSAVPMRLREWSATLAFVGRDIPQIRWQQWNDFVMAQTRGINVAERGGVPYPGSATTRNEPNTKFVGIWPGPLVRPFIRNCSGNCTNVQFQIYNNNS